MVRGVEEKGDCRRNLDWILRPDCILCGDVREMMVWALLEIVLQQ